MTYTQAPPFSIQVEPVEGCNLRCGFCGIRGIREATGDRANLSGPYNFMELDTANAIARQLAQLEWTARVEFAMHGEPCRHPQLHTIVALFRSHLPRTQLMVTTNGLPWMEHAAGPHAYLDRLYEAGCNVVALDDYRPHVVAPHVRDYTGATVREYPEDTHGNPHTRHPRGTRLLSIIRDISESSEGTHAHLSNHAGSAAPRNTNARGKRCANPFREIAVRWDGSVALCCNDWRGQFKVGHAVDDGLEKVWHAPVLYAARRFLYQGDRAGLEPCAGCDHLSPRVGLLPDKHGKVRLPRPDDADRAAVAAAVAGETLTPVVLRRYERSATADAGGL